MIEIFNKQLSSIDINLTFLKMELNSAYGSNPATEGLRFERIMKTRHELRSKRKLIEAEIKEFKAYDLQLQKLLAE